MSEPSPETPAPLDYHRPAHTRSPTAEQVVACVACLVGGAFLLLCSAACMLMAYLEGRRSDDLAVFVTCGILVGGFGVLVIVTGVRIGSRGHQ